MQSAFYPETFFVKYQKSGIIKWLHFGTIFAIIMRQIKGRKTRLPCLEHHRKECGAFKPRKLGGIIRTTPGCRKGGAAASIADDKKSCFDLA